MMYNKINVLLHRLIHAYGNRDLPSYVESALAEYLQGQMDPGLRRVFENFEIMSSTMAAYADEAGKCARNSEKERMHYNLERVEQLARDMKRICRQVIRQRDESDPQGQMLFKDAPLENLE